MDSRQLVFMDSKSSKFWNIQLDGVSHTVTYGRIGTDGQSKTKEFPSEDKAKKEFDKLVAAKLGKGYVDSEGAGVASDDDDSGSLPFIAFASIHKQDDVYQNVRTFIGKRVADYDPDKGPARGGKTIYRFRSDYDDDTLMPHLEHFVASTGAAEATGIVIGNWAGDDPDTGPEDAIELLVKNSHRLSSLAAVYLGDITAEENEMSWITQADVSALLDGFPDLQLLRTRGGNSLKLSNPKHQNLRALAMESGGLPVDVVRSICTSDFPNLEYLELWLGTDEYGGDSSVQDLQPILSGKLFPKLKYLGLRNCQYADDLAAVIVNSPIIDRLEMLDLSLGVLTDEGAQALLSLPEGGTLKSVSLHFNYASDGVLKKLKSHSITFDTSKPSDMEDDDEWRFVAVGE